MTLANNSSLKQLTSAYAAGAPVTVGELRKLGVSSQLAYWYANNGWLERLGRGVFVRDSKQLDLRASLRALELLGKSFHVGGRAALSWQGIRHFLRHKDQVVLYGTNPLVLPEWLTSRFNVVYRRRRLFTGRGSDQLGVKRLDDQSRSPLAAEPERAILEFLSEVPQRASLEEAKLLMEGLLTLRTGLLQRLLGQCASIKTVRLFLTLSRELKLQHLATLNEKVLPKGSTSRYVYRGRSETLILKP